MDRVDPTFRALLLHAIHQHRDWNNNDIIETYIERPIQKGGNKMLAVKCRVWGYDKPFFVFVSGYYYDV